jgi:cyclomaltodextrinase
VLGSWIVLRRARSVGGWRWYVVYALWCICACAAPAERAPAATSAQQVKSSPRLHLLPEAADVFAFQLEVRLEGADAEPLRECELLLHDGRRQLLSAARTARLALRSGANTVEARCDTTAGRAVYTPPVRYTVRLPEAPRVSATLLVQGSHVQLRGHAEPAHVLAPELVDYTWYAAEDAPAYAQLTRLGQGDTLTLPLPTSAGDHVYALQVRDARGVTSTAYTVLRSSADSVHPKQPGELPDWLPGSVLYGVYPPLYGSPGLVALRDALPDLEELGVGALWLSPVFVSPPGDYGYAVVDGFHVRDEYGSDAALRALVDDAHARGLRVLLDLIPNHTSSRHPYFDQAERHGPRSHYFSFYDRDAQGKPTHYFDWTHLPNLDYAHPEVAAFSQTWAEHWLRQARIDGYRVDAAWGIQQRDPSFWPEFTQQLADDRPQLLLVAEASARDAAYVQSGFHAAYDWSEELGHHAWEHVFAAPNGIVQRLHEAVSASTTTPPNQILRFLNNNDTGARFITRHGEGLTRVATAALLTLPGIPCLFAFDEQGAEYEPYAAPGTITQKNPALRAFHRQLIALRRRLPALQGAAFHALHVGQGEEVYVYQRGEAGERAMVALNFSARPATVTLALPDPVVAAGGRLRDAIGGGAVQVRRKAVTLQLGAWASQLWLPERAPVRSRSAGD